MKKLLLSAAFAALGTAGLQAAVVVGNLNSIDVNYTDFTIVGAARGAATLPVSTSQSGGVYTIAANDAVASVASGSSSGQAFALTFTNNTGADITGFTLSGTVYQYKDNSSNLLESLTAAVSGLSLTDADFNISAVSNDGNTASTPNNPPLTAAYSVSSSGFVWANGSSFTITWSDANDGGTDAMFGLGNVNFQAQAVPEPSTYALIGLGLGGLLVLRRMKKSSTV